MIHNLDRQLQLQQPHCCARYRHALERRYYHHPMSLRMHACSTKAFILIVLILVVSNTSRNRMDVSAFCISSSNDNLNTIRHQYYNGQQHLRSLGNYDQQCDHKHNNNGRPGHVLTKGRRKHITPTIYPTTLFAAIDPTFIDTTIQVLSAQTTTIVSSPSSTILSFPTIGLGLPNINGGIPFLNGISALGAAAIVTSAASLLYTIRTLLLNDRIVEEINEMEFNLTRRRDQEVGQSQKAYGYFGAAAVLTLLSANIILYNTGIPFASKSESAIQRTQQLMSEKQQRTNGNEQPKPKAVVENSSAEGGSSYEALTAKIVGDGLPELDSEANKRNSIRKQLRVKPSSPIDGTSTMEDVLSESRRSYFTFPSSIASTNVETSTDISVPQVGSTSSSVSLLLNNLKFDDSSNQIRAALVVGGIGLTAVSLSAIATKDQQDIKSTDDKQIRSSSPTTEKNDPIEVGEKAKPMNEEKVIVSPPKASVAKRTNAKPAKTAPIKGNKEMPKVVQKVSPADPKNTTVLETETMNKKEVSSSSGTKSSLYGDEPKQSLWVRPKIRKILQVPGSRIQSWVQKRSEHRERRRKETDRREKLEADTRKIVDEDRRKKESEAAAMKKSEEKTRRKKVKRQDFYG